MVCVPSSNRVTVGVSEDSEGTEDSKPMHFTEASNGNRRTEELLMPPGKSCPWVMHGVGLPGNTSLGT